MHRPTLLPFRLSFDGPRSVAAALVLFAIMGSSHPACAAVRVRGGSLHGSVNGRQPGYLGIVSRDASADDLHASHPAATGGDNHPHGAEVVMVDHDGPAGVAGLRVHDIIVGLNGHAVAGAEALRRMLDDAAAGMQVALTVLRGGHTLTLSAQLGNRVEVARAAMAHLAQVNPEANAGTESPAAFPASGFADRGITAAQPTAPTAPATPPPGSGFLGHIVHGGIYTGAVLDTMEPQLAGFFGAPQGDGLLVHSVVPGSPAADAGLRAGDIVLRADLYPLHSNADWAKRLHVAKGRPITLTVLRDRRELMLTLQQDFKHHSLLEWPGGH